MTTHGTKNNMTNKLLHTKLIFIFPFNYFLQFELIMLYLIKSSVRAKRRYVRLADLQAVSPREWLSNEKTRPNWHSLWLQSYS